LLCTKIELPEELSRSRCEWLAVPPNRWLLSSPEGALTIRQTVLNYRVVWTPRVGDHRVLGEPVVLGQTVRLAEAFARGSLGQQTLRLLDKSGSWGQRPVTDKQKATLDRLGIEYSDETTAGEAAQAIALRRAGMNEAALRTHLAGQSDDGAGS
jgi:hypothetical protein